MTANDQSPTARSEAPLGLTMAPLALFAVLAATFKIRAWDVFWHLASGRWILEHRAIPNVDPFRFTAEGHPWVDHEWLFQVGLALTERLGGFTGLAVMRIAAALVVALVLWRAARGSGTSRVGAALLAGAAVFAARPRFFLRPELWTLVALALLLERLAALRSRPRAGVGLSLVALLVVWANFHPGVLLAPILTGAFLVGTRLPGASTADPPVPWAWVLGLPPALLLATLLNPSGWRLWAVPFEISGALENVPGTNPEWLPLWQQPQPVYFAALALMIGIGWLTWRRTGSVDPATGLVALALAILGSTSVRHMAPFVVGGAFFAADGLGRLRRAGWAPPLATARARWLPAAAALLALIWCIAPPRSGPLAPWQGRYTFGLGLEPNRYPERAADFVAAQPGIGNLYNNVAFGGYLLWRFYPPRTIFNDGRNEVNPTFLRELAAARQGSAAWNALLERYAIDGALVRYDPRRRPVVEPPTEPGGAPRITSLTSNAVLFPPEQFALVHWDDVAMVFLVRRPDREPLLTEIEYHVIFPEDPEAVIATAERDPAYRRAALLELERKLKEDPGCQRAGDLAQALLRLYSEGRSDATLNP